MPNTLELRSADSTRKEAILRNLYGATDAATLRAASSKTDAEIMSAQGNVLIASLQSARAPGVGCFHFTTSSATAQTIYVRSSTGYARVVYPDNTTPGNATGTVNNIITLTVPAGTGHRPYAIIAVTGTAGTTATGNITSISASARMHSIYVNGLSLCTTIDIGNNLLTSFFGEGLYSCTSLTLNNNELTEFISTSEMVSCTNLVLNGNKLTSFDGTGLTACTNLLINDNQLISFNGSGLAACTNLSINTNASILESFILHPNSFSANAPSIAVRNGFQTTESLNMILSALPVSYAGLTPTIDIRNNTGSLTCDPSLAPSAWTIITS